jgi:hypothetical protein
MAVIELLLNRGADADNTNIGSNPDEIHETHHRDTIIKILALEGVDVDCIEFRQEGGKEAFDCGDVVFYCAIYWFVAKVMDKY